MKSNGWRLACLIVVSFAFLGSFLTFRAVDDDAIANADWLIVVEGSPDVSSQEFVATVQQFATEHAATIGRAIPDLTDPARRRHVYLAVGSSNQPEAIWLSNGYPAFSRDTQTVVHPFEELAATDSRGQYTLSGSLETHDALREQLESLGYEVATRVYHDPPSIAIWLLNQLLGWSFLITVLLVALLVAASVVSGVKGYAVQRLQGAGYWQLLRRDLAWAGRFAAVTLLGGALIAAVFLGWYNRWNQWQPYAAITACVLVALFAVAVAAHALALLIAQGLPILESLKGRIPARWAIAGLYLVRLPAIAVAILALLLAAFTLEQFAGAQLSREAWRRAGDAVYLNLSPDLPPEEVSRLSIDLGEWLAEAEAQGQMVLAYQDRYATMAADLSTDVLIVNDNYLAAQPVLNAAGQRIEAVGDGHILVIVPASLSAHREQVVAAAQEWVSLLPNAETPKMAVVDGAPGQPLFNYGNVADRDSWALLQDPVVLVVNSGTGVIDADTYTAWATDSGVFLQDLDWAAASLEERGLLPFILGFRHVGQNAAAEYGRLVQELRVHAFNLFAVLGVLLATAVGVGEVYSRKNAQRTFAMYISGWRFSHSHQAILSGELILALAIAGWAVVPVLTPEDPHGLGAPSLPNLLGIWYPIVLLGLAAANFAIFLLALRYKTRKLILTHSPEAQA